MVFLYLADTVIVSSFPLVLHVSYTVVFQISYRTWIIV